MVNLIKTKIHTIFIKLYLKYYKLEKANIIFTHLTVEEKITLHKISRKISRKNKINCAEIGSYLGSSSCFISSGLSNKSMLYCIDTWENDFMIYSNEEEINTNNIKKQTFDEFIVNTSNYAKKIKILKGWSYNVIGELKTQIKNLDLLFVDGDHSYEGVKLDWDLYKILLKKNSIIIFHDISWAEGVNKLIEEEIKPICNLKFKLQNMAVYQLL